MHVSAGRARRAAGLALLACAAAAAPLAGQQPEAVVTLEEAIEAAGRNHPALIQGRGAVRTAEAGERSAWGSFLPSVSLSSGASRSSTERFNPQTNTTVSGSRDTYSAGLASSLHLLTAGRRRAELAPA